MEANLKVRLTKIESNHERLRTPVVVGILLVPPTIGRSIVIVGEPIEKTLDSRCVATSQVKEIKIVEDHYIVTTQNSIYKLELI